MNTDEWTLTVKAADGSDLSGDVLRIEFHLPEDLFHGYLPKNAAARAGSVEQQRPMVAVEQPPYELKITGWRACKVGIVAHKQPPDHAPVIEAYLRAPLGERWLRSLVGKRWMAEGSSTGVGWPIEGPEWAARLADEAAAAKQAAEDAETAGVRAAEAKLAAAHAAVEAASTPAEKEAAMIKLDGAKRKFAKETKKLEKLRGGPDKAFVAGFNAGGEGGEGGEGGGGGTQSGSAWAMGMHEPEPEPAVYDVQGPTNVGFLAQEIQAARMTTGDGDSDDEEAILERLDKQRGDHRNLTVVNIHGDEFTIEARETDTIEDLIEMIRDAEDERK